ncbi:hypothetical protein AMTRI_Chr07g76690 [Amborella trichopoda]
MASCAAVCSCCTCGLVNLLVLAMVKLPASLCKRALRRKKREKKGKKDVLIPNRSELLVHPIRPAPTGPENWPEIAENWPEKSSKKQVEEMVGEDAHCFLEEYTVKHCFLSLNMQYPLHFSLSKYTEIAVLFFSCKNYKHSFCKKKSPEDCF